MLKGQDEELKESEEQNEPGTLSYEEIQQQIAKGLENQDEIGARATK